MLPCLNSSMVQYFQNAGKCKSGPARKMRLYVIYHFFKHMSEYTKSLATSSSITMFLRSCPLALLKEAYTNFLKSRTNVQRSTIVRHLIWLNALLKDIVERPCENEIDTQIG